MICPNCKCEYIRGVTQCPECGVTLVDSLDPFAPDRPEEQGAVSVWEGSDPGEFATVKDALEEAGIPVIDQEAAGHLFFPSMPPKTDIYVSAGDVEQAKKVLRDLGAWADPDEMTEEERESLALPDSELSDADEEANLPPDSPDEWSEDDSIVEVWTGERKDLAENLTACLSEVGIGSRKSLEVGQWRLVVRSEHEARAKEVVREVVEERPPE